MMNSYEETCNKVLSFEKNKDINIQKSVIELLPSLAGFNPNLFNEKYLHSSFGKIINSKYRYVIKFC
jgi:hypothetical protein